MIEYKTHLKDYRFPRLIIKHGIVADLDDELGMSLGDRGRDLEGSIVIDQGEWEHAVLARVVVIHLWDVGISEGQSGTLRSILIQVCDVARIEFYLLN